MLYIRVAIVVFNYLFLEAGTTVESFLDSLGHIPALLAQAHEVCV